VNFTSSFPHVLHLTHCLSHTTLATFYVAEFVKLFNKIIPFRPDLLGLVH
jgi:hypothetical protein